jgi:phosphoglycerol transferase
MSAPVTDTIASLFWLATFLVPLAVVVWPKLQPDKPGLVAFCCLCAALWLDGEHAVRHADLWLVAPTVAAALLIPGVVLSRAFLRIDMIAILFHRDFGMKGADLAGLKNEIATACLSAGFMATAVVGLHGQIHWPPAAALAATGVMVAVNPFVRIGLRRLLAGPTISVLPERIVRPHLGEDVGDRPDIVMIYLEGTDRQFADVAVHGPICARLDRFAREAATFTRVGQIAGTGWSLAGMVASQSGVPITPRGLRFQHDLEKQKAFMPGVTFLGDILKAKGYRSHYAVGGERGFGGIEAMYTTHGVSDITDLQTMRQLFPAEEFAAAQIGWFADDQMTLEAARRDYDRLLSGDSPFALIVETIGPHGPHGYLSRRFTRSGRAEETRDIPRAVGHLVDEVMDFVDDIRARHAAAGRDLRIVILSDHLNHLSRLPRTGPAFGGHNTVILWGRADMAGQVIDRAGSMIDVFPTLLEWLGWARAPVAAGLGRSLLSSAPTLVEELGIDRIDAMIVSDARLARTLWADQPGPSATLSAIGPASA